MQKSLRSIILVAIVSLTAAPVLHADVMGTNPRPTRSVATPSLVQQLFGLFGF